jgi:LPXTG-motif cell wall-anchored protein
VNLLKRAQTVTAGAVLGLIGVASFAGPALACHPLITPVESCVNADGTWVVTWQVATSERNLDGTVTEVKANPADSTVTGIVVGAAIPANKTITGEQKLPASADTASIAVTAEWDSFRGKIVNTRESREVRKPETKCESDTPPPPPTTAPTPTQPTPSSPSPTPSSSVSTSASASPSASVSTSASPSPSAPPVPVTEPQFVYDATCDTLTVGIEVPEDWSEGDLTVTFTPTTGAAKTVVAKPGETKTVDFPASEGLKVTATPKGHEDEAATVTYERPADCDSSGGGGSDGGGNLPKTGAAVSTWAGGAVALLAIGAGVFFLARRRKVKFTA